MHIFYTTFIMYNLMFCYIIVYYIILRSMLCNTDIMLCQDETTSGGKVYYTTDGSSTPTTSSKNVLCSERIFLKAPGKITIRAFVVQDGLSPSSIFQAVYVLERPHYDEIDIISDDVTNGKIYACFQYYFIKFFVTCFL